MPARTGDRRTRGSARAPARRGAGDLLAELRDILGDFDRAERDAAPLIAAAHPDQRPSAMNLLHYLALRRRDLRDVQDRLSALGLSSLGRAESDVRASVQAVHDLLAAASSHERARTPLRPAVRTGRERLAHNARALLGPSPTRRSVRIMVTMPSDAASDAGVPRVLRRAGMDLARINCAHDTPEAWSRMAAHIAQAAGAARGGEAPTIPIVMDLPGPKVRTGPIEPGPPVLKIRPVRDVLGRVQAPAAVWLAPPGAPPRRGRAHLPVDAPLLARIRRGDVIAFTDTRGSRRTMRVTRVARGPDGPGAACELTRTAYVLSGTRLRVRRTPPGRSTGWTLVGVGVVGPLPAVPGAITLRPGDALVLTTAPGPGHVGARDADGRQTTVPTVACTLPEALAAVRRGDRVLFDDGKIAGVVERAARARRGASADSGVLVRITVARAEGSRLRADKGINFPDSPIDVPALTPDDLRCLPVIKRIADAVCYSFVRRESDVRRLHDQLARAGRPDMPVILKIENREAFERLPALLLEGMRRPLLGVMIARGDLAVELGYERLAEVQEEILWLCEAAHAPVIWATQVLESLASTGRPSRAEVTDAAMGQRAECVMLNKGPYVDAAVRTLDDILRRMHGHQAKKAPRLRRLSVAEFRIPPRPRRR